MVKENYFAIGWKPPWESMGGLYLQYAEVYKDAAELLLKDLQELGGHSYKPLPLLYLFRHYIELQLTGLIAYGAYFSRGLRRDLEMFLEEKRRSHNLMKLFNKLQTYEQSLDFPKEFSTFLANLDNFDKASDRFRYPENKHGEEYFSKKFDNDQFINIINRATELTKYIGVVINHLESIEAYFEVTRENYEETLRMNAEMNAEYSDYS